MRTPAGQRARTRRRLVTLALGGLVVLGAVGAAPVPPEAIARDSGPQLDPTFGGGDGASIRRLGGVAGMRMTRVHRLRDGRLLVVGGRSSNRGEQLVAGRFLRDGTLDVTYGGNGYAAVRTAPQIPEDGAAIGGLHQPPVATGVDDVGGVTIAEVLTPATSVIAELVAVRFDEHGRLDRRYGDAGIARHTAGPSVGGAVRTTPLGGRVFRDGSVLMAAWTTVAPHCSAPPCPPHDSHLALVRLTRSGDLDTTFGSAGVAVVPTPEASIVTAFATDAAGRSVAVGTTYAGGLFAQRYRADGSPDTTFGTASVSFVQPDVPAIQRQASATAIDRHGRIVIASGEKANLEDSLGFSRIVLLRLDGAGVVDGSFGRRGLAKITLPENWNERGLAVTDERIVVIVGSLVRGRPRVALVAFDRDGRNSRRSDALPHAPFGPFGVALGRDAVHVVGTAFATSGHPAGALYRLLWSTR